MAFSPLVYFYSQWSGSVWGGWGTGDANWALHPGPPAGADRSRKLHQLQLQPDAISTRQQLCCHAGLWEGSERHLCEYIYSDYSYLRCVRLDVFIYSDCLPVRSAGNADVRFLLTKMLPLFYQFRTQIHKACPERMMNGVWKRFQSLNMPVQVYFVINVYVSDLRWEYMEGMCVTRLTNQLPQKD